LDILDDICSGGELDSIVDEELLDVDDEDDDGNDEGQIFKFFE